jgi:hypothetical protein
VVKVKLSIQEIIFGQADAVAFKVEMVPDAINIIPVADPALWTQTLIEILSQSEARTSAEQAPFIRIRAKSQRICIAIADDMLARVRILEESIDGRIPLMIDAHLDHEADDPKRDTILSKIARAFDIPQAELMRAGLTQVHSPNSEQSLSDDETQFINANQHALALAGQVHQIDDQMTASVVPGWLFVACGVGSLFVLMTAITLFYPELRRIVIPAMIVCFFTGLAAYGWHSWKELKIRASLQDSRRQLRKEREEARREAEGFAEKLRAMGKTPDALIVQNTPELQAITCPLVLCRPDLKVDELDALAELERQVLIFVKATQVPSLPPDRICVVETLSTPS